LCFLTAHTSPNAATIGCTRGIDSDSTGEGTPGTSRRCRTCCTRVRMCTTICLLSAATSRRAGIGCAGQSCRRLGQRPAQAPWWEHQSLGSRFSSDEESILSLGDVYSSRALRIIILNLIDPVTHWKHPHQPRIKRFQRVGNCFGVCDSWIKPKVVIISGENDGHAVVDL
jgi:hypothetical protein